MLLDWQGREQNLAVTKGWSFMKMGMELTAASPSLEVLVLPQINLRLSTSVHPLW